MGIIVEISHNSCTSFVGVNYFHLVCLRWDWHGLGRPGAIGGTKSVTV